MIERHNIYPTLFLWLPSLPLALCSFFLCTFKYHICVPWKLKIKDLNHKYLNLIHILGKDPVPHSTPEYQLQSHHRLYWSVPQIKYIGQYQRSNILVSTTEQIYLSKQQSNYIGQYHRENILVSTTEQIYWSVPQSKYICQCHRENVLVSTTEKMYWSVL